MKNNELKEKIKTLEKLKIDVEYIIDEMSLINDGLNELIKDFEELKEGELK